MADEIIERMSATVLGLSQELIGELVGQERMEQGDILIHHIASGVSEVTNVLMGALLNVAAEHGVTELDEVVEAIRQSAAEAQLRHNTDVLRVVKTGAKLLAEENRMVDYYTSNYTLDDWDEVAGHDPAQDAEVQRGRDILDRLEAELGDGDSHPQG